MPKEGMYPHIVVAGLVILFNILLAVYTSQGIGLPFLSNSLSSISVRDPSALVSGVTGTLWTAHDKIHSFSGPLIFRDERDTQGQPSLNNGKFIDAWFHSNETLDREPDVSREDEDPRGSTCQSDKWVVITTIFGPTKLIYQLEKLTGWCTIVVADRRTPIKEWQGDNFARVVLLTLEEQSSLGFKISEMIPLDHFGRKNIGYLYAVRAGAKYIYDTDDDNVLKTDAFGEPVGIPIVDAKQPSHFMAQAWHCRFNETKMRSWNPYAIYGQPNTWPRGLPLEDIQLTSNPCGSADLAGEADGSNVGTQQPYTYQTVFHRLPGITFPIQQSLADFHPDVDAIYRLTRSPPTFDFDVVDNHAAGVYAPDNVVAPYNAQATLHHHAAFWTMLLPITVHGRVSDIWRSYFAQRLMQKYGMRAVFMKPWVNQERTAHDYLKDFDSEQPLYLRSGGVLDFLRCWQPSREDLTIPAEQEELMVALFEHGILGEEDVRLTQAWLQDLRDAGYQFPDARTRVYDAWIRQRFLGGLAILADGHNKLHRALALVSQQLSMFADQQYPTMVFYVDIGGRDGWMDHMVKDDLRRLCPNLLLEFYGTQNTWPRDERDSVNEMSIFKNRFLSYEMYRHPAMQRLRYLLRIDDDVTSFTESDHAIVLDFFKYMSAHGLEVVGFQGHARDDQAMHLCPRSRTALLASDDGSLRLRKWKRVEEGFCRTMATCVGFMELYELRTLRNPTYFHYLESIDFMQGLYLYNWQHESFKSIWLFAISNNSTYRIMPQEFQMLKHQNN